MMRSRCCAAWCVRLFCQLVFYLFFFFFFQAEDGIRDVAVTGVQTCALPIFETLGGRHGGQEHERRDLAEPGGHEGIARRSEERRVGEECRSRWSPDH